MKYTYRSYSNDEIILDEIEKNDNETKTETKK